MNNYVHEGHPLTVAAPYAVNSGGGVKVGNLFGVAVYNAAQNASLEIVAEGVFDLAKDASTFVVGRRSLSGTTPHKAGHVQSVDGGRGLEP